MLPHIRVCLEAERQYYFQFITSDQPLIFESIRFASKSLCAQAIREQKTTRQLDNHIHKTEEGMLGLPLLLTKSSSLLAAAKSTGRL